MHSKIFFSNANNDNSAFCFFFNRNIFGNGVYNSDYKNPKLFPWDQTRKSPEKISAWLVDDTGIVNTK